MSTRLWGAIIRSAYIYSIECEGRHYIGCTVDCYHRFAHHLHLLRYGKHHCQHLQRLYNKYGEDKLKFEVLVECDEDEQWQLELETWQLLEPHERVAQSIPLGYRGGGIVDYGYRPVLVNYNGNYLMQWASIKAACRELGNSASAASTTMRNHGRIHIAEVNHKSRIVRPLFGWLVLEDHLSDFDDWH